jgi:hypothetical protein
MGPSKPRISSPRVTGSILQWRARNVIQVIGIRQQSRRPQKMDSDSGRIKLPPSLILQQTGYGIQRKQTQLLETMYAR